MYSSRIEENSATVKLMGLLLFLIGIWFINILMPVYTHHPIAYPMTYSFRMLFVCYSMAIVFSIFVIKQRTVKIKNNDLVIAFTLGVLGGTTDIFLAIATTLAYIASMVMLKENNKQVPFFIKPKDMIDSWVMVTIIVFLYMMFYVQFNSLNHVSVVYGTYMALTPGITQEVMFRLFLFAVAMKITKGQFSNKNHKLIIWLILIVPLILLQEPNNYGGVGQPISYVSIFGLMGLVVPSIIATWLFLKRSLLAAITFSVFLNAYHFGISYYNAGNSIFYLVQPKILEVVFGVSL